MVARSGLLLLCVGVDGSFNASLGASRAGTTRYWDCSGGSCGASIPEDAPLCTDSCTSPFGDPPRCAPHDWAPRWMKHEGKSILYAAAAASDKLYCGKSSDCAGWGDGEACGKCYLLTNPGGCSSGSPKLDRMIVRVSNLCPGNSNTACNDQYHFDISAPGFDSASTSTANVCSNCDTSVPGSGACASGSIEDCDCSQVSSDPAMVQGCENFKLLGWDNCDVDFEEIPCPTESAPGQDDSTSQPPTTAPVEPTTEEPTTAPTEPTQEPTEPTTAPAEPTQEPTTAPAEPTTQSPDAPITTQAPSDDGRCGFDCSGGCETCTGFSKNEYCFSQAVCEGDCKGMWCPTEEEDEEDGGPEDDDSENSTTVQPQTTTEEPEETTTTTEASPTPSPTPPYPGFKACHACLTMCAPCQACANSQEGECSKCWHCWDWDDDELEDDDDDMNKKCDAMHQKHDWDDAEVRCLHNDSARELLGGDGRRRNSPADGRRRNSPSELVMDCRACWSAHGKDIFDEEETFFL